MSDSALNGEFSVKYEVMRDMIAPGDIMSFIGTSPVSRIIQILSIPNHVAGVVSGPECMCTRKLMIEADEGEVNARALSNEIRQYKGKIYWHRLNPCFDRWRSYIDSYYWEQIGKKYDYKGFFSNIFGRINKNCERYICSELCQGALANIPKTQMISDLHAVSDIYDSVAHKDIEDCMCYVEMLYSDKVMRPCDIVKLPIFSPRVEVYY
jgi:hypothetical protein